MGGRDRERESGRVTWRANHSVRQRALPFILSLCSASVSHISLSVCLSFSLSTCPFVCLSLYLAARPLSVCLCSVSCTSFFYVSFEQEILSTEIMRKRQATATTATTRATVAAAAATITTMYTSTCLLVFHVVFKVFFLAWYSHCHVANLKPQPETVQKSCSTKSSTRFLGVFLRFALFAVRFSLFVLPFVRHMRVKGLTMWRLCTYATPTCHLPHDAAF